MNGPMALDVFHFEGELPSEVEARAYFKSRVGLPFEVESYQLDEAHNDVSFCCGDAILRAYLMHFLRQSGGEKINRATGTPIALSLPEYVTHPWREQPLMRRTAYAARTSSAVKLMILPVALVVEPVFLGTSWIKRALTARDAAPHES